MKASPADWTGAVIERLALNPATRLTLALDSDGLLLDDTVLSVIQAQGVGVLTYEPERFAAFRYTYETDYRARWADGEALRLLVRTASTEPNTFPYDLLLEAGGREAARSLALFAFFPRLAYPLLRELAHHDRAALPRLYTAYRAHVPAQRLGKQQTQCYLLEFVYGVTPEVISEPVELVRYLLRRYRLGQTPPPSLDTLLLEHWQARPALAALPLTALLRDSAALYRLLAAAWPAYLARQGFPVAAESDALAIALFDDRDIQAYMDTLFLEGRLTPTRLREPTPVYGWVQAGVFFDQNAYDRERFIRLQAELAEALPASTASYRAWLNFAPRWAEALRLSDRVALSVDETERFTTLHDAVEARFAVWLSDHYAPLATLPPIPTPALGHQVAELLAHQVRTGAHERVALLVLDGLAWDQWLVLRDTLGLKPETQDSLFAWLPTLTAISRQALLAGLPPYAFTDTWQRTDAEARRWQSFWAGQGMPPAAVQYLRDPAPEAWQAALHDSRIRTLALVLTQVDAMLHGMRLGAAGLRQQVAQWAEQGPLNTLLPALQTAGFAIWLTADHGNLEAVGIGAPQEGVLVETRGQRVRIYTNEEFLRRAHEQVPQAVAWTPAGLPAGLHLLFAPGRTAFLRRGETALCHGGLALEEVIVPLVRF